ncbi:chitinase [Amylostereum chailletii]|nr:chitinase [Amylostereum chailletii]
MKFTRSLGALLAGASLALALPSPRRPVVRRETSTDLVAASWYAGWHADDVPIQNVSWSKYTHMTYSFAITAPSVKTLSLADSDVTLLKEFVSTAHANNVTALASIGGWTGGIYFSSNVATAENRTAFVKTVTDMATNFSLDGLDFDWEYPNADGIGCNVVHPQDTSNFLSFLQELRQDPVGSQLFLTAASSVNPWNDATQTPSTNLSGFADVLDYIAIMNYDIWGSWTPTAGPNAPLNDSCASTDRQQGSAVAAVQKWHAAGIPTNKLVLGVPSYGHSFRVAPQNAVVDGTGELAAYPAFAAQDQPLGDSWDDPNPGPDVCGNAQGPEGNFDFWGMFEGGFLVVDANGTAVPAEGIASTFDECSQTPFVYNATSEVFVAYDDPRSFAAKGAFINSTGLRGFAMWETGGDYKDMLVDSIRSAVGFAA